MSQILLENIQTTENLSGDLKRVTKETASRK